MSEQPDCQMPTPTAHHARLQRDVGRWNVACTYYMDPSQPPMECTAVEEIEAVGGFWTLSRFTADFMGMPFVGRCTLGWDARKEKFVGSWIDSMSSTMFVMEGDFSADGRTLEMRCEGPHMATGDIVPMRMVTSYGDDGTHTFDMFVGNPGGHGETKAFHYVYTRAA